MEPLSHHQPEEFRRGRRYYMSDHLPELFSLASILAEQGMHHQEGF